jgi:1,4-dihydroxy-6-naphthoate synthase
MKLSLGFSPCPNDTFIFDAMVNNKIDTDGLEFEIYLEDVETLNEWALQGKLDVTKLSFPAFFRSAENYLLLNSGGALGKGVGPLLVAANAAPLTESDINQSIIVLPGLHTTAHLLFSFAYPNAGNKLFLRFDEIEDYVVANPGSLGVIIHENRFTYQQKGLHKLMDLGENWETKMHGPVPLGGIAVNQGVKRTTAIKLNKLIHDSVQFGFDHYPEITPFVKEHSQSMSEEVMRKHINLYVNQYSLDLGDDGRNAVSKMYHLFQEVNDLEFESPELLFF